nr:MAG TPA: minor capsid protein [Caudoviricetes sp.]DAO55875.1 MAG TPA: minor capsid protein [Caudoviricetes sp.]
MKYPITPEYLDAAPEPIAIAMRELEKDILREICSRFKLTGELNEAAMNNIRALRAQGLDMETIEKMIAKHSKETLPQVQEALDRVVEYNQKYYNELASKASIAEPLFWMTAADIAQIQSQTLDGYRNITRSLGFALQTNGKVTFQSIAKAYQAALDKAEVKMQSGAFTLQQSLEDAVRELADSGIYTIDYATGHRDRADVAARRAIFTGLNQLTSKYTETAAETLETDLYEITAHRGARDKGTGWKNHKAWQGKVYSTKDGSKYPNIYKVCGLGAVDGLEGANCRHHRHAFLEGVSERVYTDDELANIDPPPVEFEGRTYSAYEATQMQRKMERTVRKLERRRAAYNAAGMTGKEEQTGIRIRRLKKEYREFSRAASLPTQTNRMKVIE